MATIAGPRPSRPCQVSTLVPVTTFRTKIPLKRSPRKQETSQATQSLRDSYLAASITAEQKTQVLGNLPQPTGIWQDQDHSAAPETNMAPSSGYERLSSGRSSPASANTPIAPNGTTTDPEAKLTRTQSDVDTSPATPKKTLAEKALPPKPTLRAQDSPERRGVFDATDLTARSLNGRYPPLKPQNSPESGRSDQQSPSDGSFEVTPSLLSNGHSPNSVSTGVVEYGVATSNTIQSIINPQFGTDGPKAADLCEEAVKHSIHEVVVRSSSSRYILNAPGSIKPQRHGSVLKTNQPKNESPSRSSHQSSSGAKISRSIPHGRQSVSVRGRQSLHLPNARRDSQGAVQQEDVRADLALTAPLFGGSSQQARIDNRLEESPADEGTERTSKYGYTIRESFEARNTIMGEPGPPKPKTRLGGLLSSRSTSMSISEGGPVRELKLELSNLSSKCKSKQRDEQTNMDYAHLSSSDEIDDSVGKAVHHGDGTSGITSKIGHLASAIRPPTRTPPHPPRTSSLPSTPSPLYTSSSGSNVKVGHGPYGRRPSLPEAQIGGIRSSESGKEAAQTSRLSSFYRQTAASSARASFNSKKISKPQVSTSRIPQSRTLASLGDVGKGMKNFGKKVGKIIPGRRSIAVEAIAGESLTITAENSRGPRRQASRLLTTYKNSGMNDSSDEDLRHSVAIGDSYLEPEPEDRHEPKETREDKAIWRQASRNIVTDTDTGRVIYFPPQDLQGGGSSDDDDERPPSRRRTRVAPRGHYVEAAVEEADNETGDNTVDVEDDSLLPPTRRASVGSNAADGPISNARFDRMLAETDAQARDLMAYALTLGESELRNLMVDTATHLGEGLIRVRQARMQAIRMAQAIDEISVIMATNTHRMAVILQNFPARPA